MRWMVALLLVGCTERIEDVPAVQVDAWCDAALGSPPDDSLPDLAALAVAHGGMRLFAVGTLWVDADAALIDAMEPDGDDPDERIEAWADALDEACAPAADPLGTSSATLEDGVMVLRPVAGGALAVDRRADAIALDLRGHADRAALWEAASLVLGDDVVLAERWTRQFEGLPALQNPTIYESRWVMVEEALTATGTGDLPVFVLTSQQMTPDAALLAGGLRMAGLATLVGYDVHTKVAEAHAVPAADTTLLYRASHLFFDGEPWPDVIEADISTATPEAHFRDFASMGAPGAVAGTAERPDNVGYVRSLEPPTDLGHGEMRASLMIAHGTFDRFYPYFDVVGYHLDDALLDGLDEVDDLDADDRAGFYDTLGRFMHALYDGHGFYYDVERPAPIGYLDLQIQNIGGVPVIRASDHEELLPGDTVVEVDGVAVEDWYDEAMSRRSAASDGYRFDLATRELKRVDTTRTLTVLRTDGYEYTVTPTPQTQLDMPWGGTARPSGTLDDLGAPGLYYLNLGEEGAESDASIAAALDGLDADGLVVDMRDYPYTFNHYQAASWLHTEPFMSPVFGTPVWTGPDAKETTEIQYTLQPMEGGYGGPIVWLVSNKSVSASENFAEMVVFQDNVTVVGQPSAATNGNITSTWLAGGFWVYFTGLRVLNPHDRSVLHGTGIVPDVVVTPTPEEFAAGDDPELLAAIEVLSGG